MGGLVIERRVPPLGRRSSRRPPDRTAARAAATPEAGSGSGGDVGECPWRGPLRQAKTGALRGFKASGWPRLGAHFCPGDCRGGWARGQSWRERQGDELIWMALRVNEPPSGSWCRGSGHQGAPQAKVSVQRWHPVGELGKRHEVDVERVNVEPCGGPWGRALQLQIGD